MRFFQTAFIAILAIGAISMPARADYFVWEDPKSGLTLSYPDTWGMANQRQPDEVLTLIAPSAAGDDAVCRVRVSDDKRYVIYPPHLQRDVQTIAFDRGFWDDYLAEYDNFEIYRTNDGGLGRGYGSFAATGYEGAMFSTKTARRGIVAASLYFDKSYIVDCSAKAHAFERWQPIFMGIIGSVDFKKTYDELWSGNYRNFFADPRMEFQWPGKPAVMTY